MAPPPGLAAAGATPADIRRESRMRALADMCSALSSRSVPKLDSRNPDKDFSRWKTDIETVVSSAGADFTAALEYTGNIPVPVTPGVLDDEPLPLTAPQMRQVALRALISNSIDSADLEGTPRRLIATLQFGGGQIAGVDQCWAALHARYHTPDLPKDPNQQLSTLLHPSWPRRGDYAELQAHISSQRQLAAEINLYPQTDSDADQTQRSFWWPTISSPPTGSPYLAAASRARTRCPADATLAEQQAFVDAFLDEVYKDGVAVARRTAQRRALALEVAALSADTPEVDAFALRPTRSQQSADGAGPRPTFQKHPCVRCGSTTHPRGHKCTVAVSCEVCLSKGHMSAFCWVKHGVQLYNRRLPPQVAQQYQVWHEQYKAGTYKPMPGGPPRVRVRARARPDTPSSDVMLTGYGSEDDWYPIELMCGECEPVATSAPLLEVPDFATTCMAVHAQQTDPAVMATVFEGSPVIYDGDAVLASVPADAPLPPTTLTDAMPSTARALAAVPTAVAPPDAAAGGR